MLGRMMSLLMFASVGLQPLSSMVTGALVGLNAQFLFISFGSLMILLTLLFLLNPAVRSMEINQTPNPSISHRTIAGD